MRKNALLLSFVLSLFAVVNAQLPMPTGPPENGEVRFAAIGDAGTGGKNQYRMARRLEAVQIETKFDLLLFLGDNLYEFGSPKGIEKKFLKPYRPLFENSVEFRGVIGNHDRHSTNGVLLQQMIFNMGSNTYYSFSKKSLVDFFAIDSTLITKKHRANANELQLEWLKEKLSNSKARWKIAFQHHTIYSSARKHGFEAGDEEKMLKMRQQLEPLYVKYGVRMSLNGHDHVYERGLPQNGIQYFTSGAGAKLRKGNLQKDSPYLAFGNDQVRSFMLFSVIRERINFWAIGIEGDILDSGTIY